VGYLEDEGGRMKDEGVDSRDWLLFHRGQPEFFVLVSSLINMLSSVILPPSSFKPSARASSEYAGVVEKITD
jgi:hypothetical protein